MSLGLSQAPFSQDEVDELMGTLSKLLDCDLSNWETGFCEDMLDRIEKYGVRTIISDAQFEKIAEVEGRFL